MAERKGEGRGTDQTKRTMKRDRPSNQKERYKMYYTRHCAKSAQASLEGLTRWQKEFIRNHSGLIPEKKIARELEISESVVYCFIRKNGLEYYVRKKMGYHREITPLTRYQICIMDYEGYLPEAIGNLFSVWPERVKFLLKEMKQNGEYDYNIGKFSICNEGCYRKTLEWRENYNAGKKEKRKS